MLQLRVGPQGVIGRRGEPCWPGRAREPDAALRPAARPAQGRRRLWWRPAGAGLPLLAAEPSGLPGLGRVGVAAVVTGQVGGTTAQAPTQTRRPPAPGAGQQTAVHLQLWPCPQSAPALVCTRPGLWRRSGLPGTRGSALGQDARALRRGTSSAPWRPRIVVQPGCARPRPLAAPRQTCTLFVTPLLPHSRVGAQVLRAQAGQARGLCVAPLPAGRGLGGRLRRAR